MSLTIKFIRSGSRNTYGVRGVNMSRNAVVLVGLVAALIVIGLVMVYSATAIAAEHSPKQQDAAFFLKKQLMWALVGVVAMTLMAMIPYRAWDRWRYAVLGGCVLLLASVYIPGFGAELNGARRWIRLGSVFFQPSEVAKLGMAVFLCGFAAADPERLKRFFTGFVPACVSIALVCGMIIVEPDVGTSVFIAGVMGAVLVVAGVRWTHLLPAAVGGGAVLAGYLVTHMAHVASRLETYWHPERDILGKGHQIAQSLIALGSGSWTGQGLGKGVSKLYFLPEVRSDFIFPVIGEELGFLGAAAVLCLFAAVGWTGFRIMRRAPDRFGFLLSFALTSYIILQAAMNVGVVTAAFPTKGIPLPFVSAGGSSLACVMAGVGLLLSIDRASEVRGACLERAESASSWPAAVPADMCSRA